MKIFPTTTALGLGTALAGLIASCGSSSPASVTATQSAAASATQHSSSVTAAAPATTSRSSTTSATRTATHTTTSATATTTTSPPTSVTSTAPSTTTATTRTATAPAFVETNPTSDVAISHDLAAALAVLARSGYVPVRPSTYHAGDTLRVVVGTRSGSSTPAERAFFFDQTIYLGTDTRLASAQVSLLSHNDTEATLGYAIYRAGASTPTGVRRVRFALDMGQLTALDPLPSAASRR